MQHLSCDVLRNTSITDVQCDVRGSDEESIEYMTDIAAASLYRLQCEVGVEPNAYAQLGLDEFMSCYGDALAAVANLSYTANQKHNPGERMHWARNKSTDHADCLIRHLCQ